MQYKANQSVLKAGPAQLENVVRMNTGMNVVLLLVVVAMISAVLLVEWMELGGIPWYLGDQRLLTNPDRGQSNLLGRF